jgi:hypothetical protein
MEGVSKEAVAMMRVMVKERLALLKERWFGKWKGRSELEL